MKKTPTVFQMEATECGAASLSMIMSYYGNHTSLEQLRIDTGVSRDGCKASKILQGARKYGFNTEGRRMGLLALMKLKSPCIIHWNFNHFVVFEGVKNTHAYINDPASGRRKLTINELDEGYTGVVLKLSPNDNFVKVKKEKTLLAYVKDRLKGQYLAVFYLLLAGICLIFPGLLIPIFTQLFIDDVLIGGNIEWLNILLAAMFCNAVFQGAFTFYRDKILLKLQNKISLLSSRDFLYHMIRLPISFFDQRYAGDLTERVNNNDSVCNFLAGDLAQNVLNIFVSLFYLVLLLIYSPLLTLIGVFFIVVNFLIIRFTSERISKSMMKVQQDQGKMAGVLLSGINIISTIKAAGIENEYTSRTLGYYARTIRIEQEYGGMQQMINALPAITNGFSNILILMMGGLLVIEGSLTMGVLVAFNALLSSFITPVNEMIGFVEKIQKLKADMSRVDDIMNYGTDEKYEVSEEQNTKIEKLSGKIELQEVTFGYSRLDPPLIQDFSFKLQCGENIAFVGASGSGKSTVSKVISGLYMPWSGQILVDNMPLHSVSPQVISSSISTVSQEITFFSGTIKDNITFWNKSIKDEDIIKACKDACIHDMITKKPDAYDYQLTEGGKNLSGGQRQRLEIARALVTNPTILIMDEATSALDSVTEMNIINNIKRRGCTCIIVAHRLSAIRDCDEIIVMKHGKIVERGNHDQLISQEGSYQKLMNNSAG